MSATPTPRDSPGRTAGGTSRNSASPSRRKLTGPSKLLGSGTRTVPSVP